MPSIVFGLLGLAVFLNAFGLPRSSPLVGGMTLALLVLPTIVVATRAALRAVPPSIRAAALGIGASKLQTMMHHVLPLALPGILTGTIIGMAHALGETAPLLMIGMKAFIVDVPTSPLSPAAALPVQIYHLGRQPRARVRRADRRRHHGAAGVPDPDERGRHLLPQKVRAQMVALAMDEIAIAPAPRGGRAGHQDGRPRTSISGTAPSRRCSMSTWTSASAR